MIWKWKYVKGRRKRKTRTKRQRFILKLKKLTNFIFPGGNLLFLILFFFFILLIFNIYLAQIFLRVAIAKNTINAQVPKISLKFASTGLLYLRLGIQDISSLKVKIRVIGDFSANLSRYINDTHVQVIFIIPV